MKKSYSYAIVLLSLISSLNMHGMGFVRNIQGMFYRMYKPVMLYKRIRSKEGEIKTLNRARQQEFKEKMLAIEKSFSESSAQQSNEYRDYREMVKSQIQSNTLRRLDEKYDTLLQSKIDELERLKRLKQSSQLE